ncbi:short-chain dehydrogenase [Alicyclobacillus ferrooxydans]|uniref:Short-chain dehydrogenase n=2 Tax=Alicyclobacillus ferrooxydans TaxID=471514 RepID=A0A0P9CXK5_9BACL|nr:short-chain dehydrogenase [Alicyclobacillus ferrooxydans]
MESTAHYRSLPTGSVFRGRTVVVTGAAHGFGRAIAVLLVERGATVMATDVLGDELVVTEQAMQEAAQYGGGGRTALLDVTDEASVQSLFRKLSADFGSVDILINNAGGVLGQVHKPIEEVTTSEWQSILDVNLTGAFYCIQAVAPLMKANRYGRIVNVSSGAGRSFSLTGIQAYASAKAGQIGLTRQMARELGPFQITVNNVAPGFVRSNPTTEKQWQAMGEKAQEELIHSISLRRLGTTRDIAEAVLFFASDAAAWISGQVISVDGGHHMF